MRIRDDQNQKLLHEVSQVLSHMLSMVINVSEQKKFPCILYKLLN